MKSFIFIIAPQNFRDVELLVPKQILEEAGVKVNIASINRGNITGADGAKVATTIKINDIDPNNFDGIGFIGGPGMVPLINDRTFKHLAEQFFQIGKLTSAICVAPAILANAGLLRDRKATSWSGVRQILVDSGAIWSDELVVDSRPILTASGPDAANQFGEAIIKILNY